MTEPTWIHLVEPDEAALIDAMPVDVYENALERLQAPVRHGDEPRPRMEAHGEYLFGVLVLPAFEHDTGRVLYQEVDVVVTPDRLVTVIKTPGDRRPVSLDAVQQTARTAAASSGMSLYHLVDEVAERFLTLVDDFDDDVDELEDKVDEWSPDEVRERISTLRHELLHVRRVLTPTRDLTRSVLDNRVDLEGDEELLNREVEVHFADAYDKLLRATDGLELSRDLLAGVRDYLQSKVSSDQNEVMKHLTVVASILLLPTFIVGLYGQNVKGSPELGFRYGYAWSWVLIVVTTAAQVIYFRRKRWI